MTFFSLFFCAQAISKESQQTSWIAAGLCLCFWCTMCRSRPFCRNAVASSIMAAPVFPKCLFEPRARKRGVEGVLRRKEKVVQEKMQKPADFLLSPPPNNTHLSSLPVPPTTCDSMTGTFHAALEAGLPTVIVPIYGAIFFTICFIPCHVVWITRFLTMKVGCRRSNVLGRRGGQLQHWAP